MNDQLKSLYNQIKMRKISGEDAVEQMKNFKALNNQGTLGDEKYIAADTLIPNSASALLKCRENPAQGILETTFNIDNLAGKIQKYLLSKLGKIAPNRSRLANLEINLMDLGLESSQLVSVCHEIEKETHIELTPTLFFEYPNIKELTEFFFQEHHDAFAKVLGTAKQDEALEKEEAISPKEAVSSQASPKEIQSGRAIKQRPALASGITTVPTVKDDIAIIGIHGLFAEANDLNQFWKNLLEKKDLIKEIPIDHWDYRPWYDENRGAKDKTYCKWGSFIDNVDKFDAAFFNISPREAEWMDPQIRLLLQSIYATAEDAGYINQLRGTNTGVFVGACFHDYADKIAEMRLPVDPYIATGNSQTVLANRISFLFDLKGPSMAVDTACSSSLFALHYACRALHNKECGMAFVGGANLLLSSAHYRHFSSIGALSPTGRCHTFDAAADGYVPGECVASILLKPLQQAKRDGDHIYAVIKGSAALHGGYTPSLTAPSVAGEENVILKAWEDAGIDPESISYIEAHGTGTKLGDPIEIDSIKKAFRRFTKKEHFCAVGSAKASIGHAEGAAGIAGLLKVILQMKNKQIPCLPRFKNLNPYIQLDKSALYINREVEEWKSPAGVPRRAGISSFGFSGAYAHAVIEEYIPENQGQPKCAIFSKNPAIIVLSAKKQDRLQAQAERLLNTIREQQFTDSDLADIAYTLQVGREAMEERLGLIVSSIKELEEKLQGFLDGRDEIPDLYRGQVKHNQETMAVFTADDDMQKTIDAWISKGKYSKLLELWVKGLSFDWDKLYGNIKPRRISLPTYPFAGERYWIPESDFSSSVSGAVASFASSLHPLLHQNMSDLAGQRFSSTFTGREFFLADHVVKGQRVLPGVAYLEMARAAVEASCPLDMTAAAGPLEEGKSGIRLKNVVWARPIMVGERPVQVHIGIYPEENSEIAYEIYSGTDEEVIIHSQGSAVLSPLEEAPGLDLAALKMQCGQNIISANQCYEVFKKMGFDYGPGHQAIKNIYMGPAQMLAELALPSSVFDTKDQFVLHPSLMDAALQASLMMNPDNWNNSGISLKPSLPFALQEIEILGNCVPRMWAAIRYSEGGKATDKTQKLDIDICDGQGTICVRLRGFTLRVLEGEVGARERDLNSSPDFGTLMLEPVWKEQAVMERVPIPDYEQYLTIFCEPDVTLTKSINNQMKEVAKDYRCLILQSKLKNIDERFQAYTAQVFEEIQRIFNEKPKNKVLVQIVISTQPDKQLFSGLFGLLKTAQLENPKFIGQLIEIEPGENAAGVIHKLMENSRDHIHNRIRYQNGKRWVADWSEVAVRGEETYPWKDQGIYLITGGAGGLGLIFAEEIIQRAKDVTLILTGRSKLNEEKQAKIEELQLLGSRVDYRQVDVTRNKEVKELILGIKKDYGSLHGIIHGAGIIRDNYIIKKNKEELQEVLLPKVTGLVNLDLATQDLDLDFFILFSSFVGSLGNPGQADYATANAFMDAYAGYRNSLVASGERHGRTFAIDWPLWKEGGMHVDEASGEMMAQTTGMVAMRTATGVRALYQGLASGKTQLMVIEGKLSRMRQKIFATAVPLPPAQSNINNILTVSDFAAKLNTGSIFDQLQSALNQIVSKLLKVKIEDIDLDTELSEYGFDSILFTQFANQLNEEFKLEITPAIFFEYPTLRGFIKYLIDEYQTVFASRFTVQISKSSTTSGPTSVIDTSNLLGNVQSALIQVVSKLLKVKSEDIDPNTELSEYGFDSILFTQFANKLNEEYKLELTPAIFFEHPTINGFAKYLTEEYQAVFAPRFTVQTRIETPVEERAGLVLEDDAEEISYNRKRRPRFSKIVALPESKQVSYASEPIAIIGMSGIFPGAGDVNEFWNNLLAGKDCITEIPKERWDWREYYGDPAKEANKTNIKWGGFINGIDEFDPLFFGISPKEAELMDPQQRLLMMYVWKAIEDAGYSAQSLSGTNTGIFVGTVASGYSGLLSQANIAVEGYSSTGMIPSVGPNRMSYFLNIHGPSEPIETACSSSLVALHRAVNAMENGACEMAIVGGVNTMVTPEFHISFNKAGMLCEDGRCKTFSDQANGYVRGEGAGMVFLKKLSAAERDGDHIYGIIRSTAENHGGRANSLTAPNPKAQAELLITAYTKAGIDPRTVTYIEAHGTGTKLGDPIEINGLKMAFKELYQATGDPKVASSHCGLGSVKTNIGHLEFAAGIAGVIKVLLQLKHKTLVKSLHCDTINPYIDLKESPFYIVRENQEWKALQDAKGRDLPRRAGVSSFGFGGVNAHAVIEEYVPKVQEKSQIMINTQNPAIIVLSAKNEERLKEQVRQLINAMAERQFAENSLADIAYTLQVGREPMEERLAMIVGSMKEFEDKLKDFIEGKNGITDLYRGQVKRNQEMLAVFTADEDLQKAIDTWVSKGKYAKLLDLWVKGLSFDWNKLYGNNKPRRISLPTYPFAKERYWIPENNSIGISYGKFKDANDSSAISNYIHPLLHQNTSNFAEQRFSSAFTGREFFLADHVVKGQRVLPGVVYLEMARVAVEKATEVLKEGQTRIRLKNVVWAQPIVVGEKPVKVNIGLFPEENGEIAYEIYSEHEDDGVEVTIHSQGSAWLSSFEKTPVLDLDALKVHCNQNIFSSNQCYEIYKAMGFEYGPGHQGIKKLYVGPKQVLAELSIPSSVFDTKDQFVLHPSLLDAALQASLMLNPDNWNKSSATLKPVLPFALHELEIQGNCVPQMWAWIRFSEGSKVTDTVQKLDIDICDDQGTICIRMKGFTLRILEGEIGARTRDLSSSSAIGTLMLEPVWKEQAVIEKVPVTDYAQYLTILCEPDVVIPKNINNQMIEISRTYRCLTLQSNLTNIDERFLTYAEQIFEEIQRILSEKPKSNVLIQIVVSSQPEQHLFTGLFGLLKTAQLENPKLIGQLIEIESGENSAGLIEKLKENARASHNHIHDRIRYQDGKRWIAEWSKVPGLNEDILNIPWKDRGIYLITGGAGGLGLIFAKEIANRAKDVTLILTGRSMLSGEKQAKLEELQSLGSRVDYRQVDVTQNKEVIRLIQYIRENYGSLQGIIHGAGIIRDNYIIKKNKEELREVLLPKVTGLVNLDLASKELDLDFFILFSSIAGSLGNPGQADYSAANAFMDAFAKYRNTLVAMKQRHGHTLSINWPLWKDGGMQVDEETEKIMMQTLGMAAMKTSSGIRALYQCFASGKSQIMVMEGKLDRMKQKFLSKISPEIKQIKEVAVTSDSVDVISLLDNVQSALRKVVSILLKVKINDIDLHTELSEYGFDSISLTQFANALNEEYNLELTPAIFFEHPTINDFAKYLIEEYQAVFASHFSVQSKVEIPVQERAGLVFEDDAEEKSCNIRRRTRFSKIATLPESKQPSNVAEPVAIIGMSGIFPGAGDINEFWNNLLESKDCITEIPKERWDWREYYGDPVKDVNKTNIKWGGFIDGVDEFDPLFFGISPKEAELMDPQQRLLMMYVWKAIEDAGYSAQSLSGTKTGIYVGTANTGYSGLISRLNIAIEGYSATGLVSSVGPNRMSYFLNIHGPSEPIETACSSSLVALHRAVCAIQDGNCEMAIAGGINTILTPDFHISFSKAGMLCEDGRCKTFSDQANGYVRGEGAGMLFLKKLIDAERDGDHIYGVIRGSAENHGGRANSLTAPNPKAQAELLVTAYTKAGIDPRTVTYIEAHGTGTKLGDPVEINALKAAFKELYQATGNAEVLSKHCGLGSVKTNIGHLELAAGVAGVIKVLLQMKHKTLVKSLHCDTINPYIVLNDSPFYIVRETKEWKALQNSEGEDLPRRAGVSSFGFGGVNAHVVIEEYIPKVQEQHQIIVTTQNPAIIVLSAKNENRLKEQAQLLLKAITECQFPENSLADIAYTLQVGREAMEERMAMLVGSMKELEDKLKGFIEGQDNLIDFYRGQVKRNQQTLGAFTADEDLQKTIDAWISKGKYNKLLDLWVKGFSFDWNKLYGDKKPRRISLPTYPFAKERYWFQESYCIPDSIKQDAVSSPQENIEFDDSFYERLMDELINNTINIDTAVQRTNLHSNKMKISNFRRTLQ